MYISATENIKNSGNQTVRTAPTTNNMRNIPQTKSNFHTRSTLLQQTCKKTTLVYLLTAAFCIVFCMIYEQFSYGEHADCMRLMFLLPLLGGAVPFGILAYSRGWRGLSRVGYNLWNSGIAVLSSGCLIKGIIEISGRTSDYDMFYWIGGTAMLAAAVFAQIWKYTEK